jgi:L-alanine-DL-glutamate epimerase-like enolase superfamily enzyme
MSWGYTLPSVANLHLMLSSLNCSYYEQPLPYDTFEFGMKDILRTKKDGYVYGPEKSGLGVEVDWDQMKRKCIHSIYCDKKKLI